MNECFYCSKRGSKYKRFLNNHERNKIFIIANCKKYASGLKPQALGFKLVACVL